MLEALHAAGMPAIMASAGDGTRTRDAAAGARVSTAADLGTFFRALLGGRLLPPAQPAQLKQVLTPPGPPPNTTMCGYGLGLVQHEIPGCGRFWGHNGTFAGTTPTSWSATTADATSATWST
ncbi:serine hydrolase [Spirillospora sp. CA-294931]|uniref:serine hydrolase n=1 Tax=Spirillospora sp. CA-294931 TaxID=3240042 RepID=UPI003D8D1C66